MITQKRGQKVNKHIEKLKAIITQDPIDAFIVVKKPFT